MMTTGRFVRVGLAGAAAASGIAVASYAAYVAAAWWRYGRAVRSLESTDPVLDRFMPRCDVVERHQIAVDAPVATTYAVLMAADLQDSRVIQAIFGARELVLGADPVPATRLRGLVTVTKELGWVALAEAPGCEIVMGAVTQPWKANVVFRGLPPDAFAAFNEPGYVKIVWTLRADPIGPRSSMARTETRAATTDADARKRFRWYWARFSPGIVLIRQILLRLVKREAERRAANQRVDGSSTEIVVPPSDGGST